jgi:hypothetical protein
MMVVTYGVGGMMVVTWGSRRHDGGDLGEWGHDGGDLWLREVNSMVLFNYEVEIKHR